MKRKVAKKFLGKNRSSGKISDCLHKAVSVAFLPIKAAFTGSLTWKIANMLISIANGGLVRAELLSK